MITNKTKRVGVIKLDPVKAPEVMKAALKDCVIYGALPLNDGTGVVLYTFSHNSLHPVLMESDPPAYKVDLLDNTMGNADAKWVRDRFYLSDEKYLIVRDDDSYGETFVIPESCLDDWSRGGGRTRPSYASPVNPVPIQTVELLKQ